MTLCPIAIVAGCEKCPAFKMCPLKSVIGDAPSRPQGTTPAGRSGASKAKRPQDKR